jgi:hypothetical protein
LNLCKNKTKDSLFFIEFVVGRLTDQGEQDSTPGGLRKGRIITLVGQHLDLSKMAPAL